MKHTVKPLKIAIFDLTDCEGCELQFLALREELIKEGRDLEIVNWRLGLEGNHKGPYDVAFIEGSPITEDDIAIVKQARKASEQIITLGSCAVLGGVQAALTSGKRGVGQKNPKPVSYYIDVDVHLPGCPINPAELKKLLYALHLRKKFVPAYSPVCLECKAKNNACLFLEEGYCLGPVTNGGCGAICPSKGLRCYGCFGPLPGCNLPALKKTTKKNKAELDRDLRLFFSQTDEYKMFKISEE